MKRKFTPTLFIVTLLTCVIALATDPMAQDEKETKPSASAFIATHNKILIQTSGNIDVRHAPFSTFKVALALMGFDSGFLTSKDSPKKTFKKEYEQNFPEWYTPDVGIKYNWNQDHTPATFMKNSVLWYSHQITVNLGIEKFAEYIRKLNYGNQDISGTPGKNDSLYSSWLDTSLKISPREQVEFLEMLFAEDDIISTAAKEHTQSVMDREEEWNGWKLYGKTGGGSGQNGWFVGWIEKNNQRIIFAQYLDLTDPDLDLTNITVQRSTGLTAKEVVKRHLADFIR